MRIILSPAKTMHEIPHPEISLTEPHFLNETKILLQTLKSKSRDELQALYQCNEKILNENSLRIQNMNLRENLTPAIFAYEGLVFKNLDSKTLTKDELDYLQSHLRILSGFYGSLKPYDGIRSYRLEMKSKLKTESYDNLYSFWDNKLHDEIMNGEKTLINLASEEYDKCILDHAKAGEKIITVRFFEKINGKLVTKGTMAKMLRGRMTRYLAIHRIENPEQLKDFTELDYHFHAEASDENNYLFIKE